MKYTCAIIDDEPLATEVIENYVKRNGLLQIQFISNEPNDAIVKLNEHVVDILFLDINMPEISGVELLSMLHHQPFTIFTTAHQEYAVQGFELNAVDYLLKPISYMRFEKAVEKAVQRCNQVKPSANDKDYIFVKADHKLIKIRFDSIFYIEGLKDYLKIYSSDEKFPIVTLMTMKHMETLLPNQFQRIHRSYIANFDKIESVDHNQFLINKQLIPIGKSYEDDVDKLLLKMNIRKP